MPRNTVRITYDGDHSRLNRASRGAENDLDRVNSTGKRVFAGLAKSAAIGTAAVAAGFLFLGKRSADAAQEAEQAQGRMETQLRALNLSVDDHADKIERTIQAHSKLSAFDDEQLQDSFTSLVRLTGDVDKALERMALVTEVARGKKIDLEAATQIVTKAELGQLGALRRQGIEIPKVTKAQDELRDGNEKATEAQKKAAKAADETATRQAAIAALQKAFAGQAEEYGESSKGAQDRAAVAAENLQERLGNFLLPAIADVAEEAADFVGWLDEIASAPSFSVGVELVIDEVDQLRDRIMHQLHEVDWREVGQAIGDGISASIEVGGEWLEGAMSAAFHWLDAHGAELAEFGAELLVRMMFTLTDPAFWAEHWELALGVAAVALLGPVGRLAGRFVGLLGRALGAGVGKIGDEIADLIVAGLAKLPDRAALFFIELGNVAKRGLGILRGQLEEVPRWFTAAFKFTLVAGFFRLLLGAVDNVLAVVQTILEGFGRVPKIGDKFDDWAEGIGGARKQIRGFQRDLENTKDKEVKVKVSMVFRKPGEAPGDGVVSLDSALQSGAQAMFDSGIFPTLGPGASPGGLSPWIQDEYALGRGLGLSLTSGYDPSRGPTSTGGVSLHKVGQAIDMSGSPSAMATFARAVAGRSGVAEVLYTPVGGWYPGVGWVKIGGKLARDHYSHVHVGVRGADGLVGAGDGEVGDGEVGDFPPLVRQEQRHGFQIPKRHKGEKAAEYRRRVVQAAQAHRNRRREREEARSGRRGERSERAETVHERQAARQQRRRERSGGELTKAEINQQIGGIRRHQGILRRRRQALLADAARAERAGFRGLARQLRQQAQDVSSEIADLEEDVRDLIATRDKPADEEPAEEGAEPTGPSAEVPADILERQFLAEETPDTGDDISALREAEAFLEGQLAQATTPEERLPIRRALREVRERIDEFGRPAREAAQRDLQAQLEREQLKTAIAQRAAGLSEAFIRSGGVGPPQVIFQHLIPDADQIRRATEAIALGVGAQGHRPASVESIGV